MNQELRYAKKGMLSKTNHINYQNKTDFTVAMENHQCNELNDQMASKVKLMPENVLIQRKCTSCEEEKKELRRKPANASIQFKLPVGAVDDPLEREADAMADKIMRMPEQSFVQRKCDSCEEEDKVGLNPGTSFIQMKSAQGVGQTSSELTQKINATRGNGVKLSGHTKSFMESRFGSDFSNVNIHTDTKAHELSESLHAQAFTVGNDIFFNSGKYSPATAQGKHLLAHELTHVVQQDVGETGGIIQRIPIPESTIDDRIGQATREPVGSNQSTPSIPAPIDRGVNPFICFAPQCSIVETFRSAPPRSSNALFSLADNFSQALITCMQGHATSSPASHAADIHTAAVAELTRNIQNLKTWFSGEANTLANRREFINRLAHICKLTAKEIQVEYHFNVIFENPAGEPVWAHRTDDWDRIFEILSLLPQGTLWNLDNTFRLRREDCLTENGICKRSIGGIAEMDQNRVRIFSTGRQRRPYLRSSSLNLPGDFQTIIHEIGHVADHEMDRSVITNFFTNIMDWKKYPWHWINNPGGNDPTCDNDRSGLRRMRCTICTDLQMLDPAGNCDDGQLNSWLQAMSPGASSVFRGRRWWRGTNTDQHFVHSVPTTNLPQGIEFNYAKTNQGEYFAELYALAILRPYFLDNAIPREQSVWLRNVVFNIPNSTTLQRMMNLPEPANTQFLVQVQKLYTWEQINSLVQNLLNPNVS